MKAIAALLVAVLSAHIVPGVNAWGEEGHEVVATIAQIHLYQSAHDKLCDILPQDANCDLAPVSSWADKVRRHMAWSAPLHFVNANDDHPPDSCTYGETGWMGHPGQNVLSAIQNTTGWLRDEKDGAEEALKFLIHFAGDLHQPLHLAGRARGGNHIKVLFDRRHTNLHSVWDTSLIEKLTKTVPEKYKDASDYKRIEDVLRNTKYDPFVRRIMLEGILDRFGQQLDEWIGCPPIADSRQDSFGINHAEGAANDQSPFNGRKGKGGDLPIPITDDATVCPYAWSSSVHQVNCDIAWPTNIDYGNDLQKPRKTPEDDPQLDTPEYAGRIESEFLIERLLAMAGIRLAVILNSLFADQGDLSAGLINRVTN